MLILKDDHNNGCGTNIVTVSLIVVTRTDLAEYLNEFLDCKTYQDYAPNGLQIEGREKISKICTAVSASESVIISANEMNADALLVHHGYFWRGEDSTIVGTRRRRIGQFLSSNLNLFAYHLPLDCHPTLGNNACIASLLPVTAVKMHSIGQVKQLLWTGRLKKPVTADLFMNNLLEIFQQKPIYLPANKKIIERIAWCSGAAQQYIEEAYQLGVDAYISGEIAERTFYQATELDIHYFACGHHATERFGVQALGEHLANRFKVVHQFIDSQNPI